MYDLSECNTRQPNYTIDRFNVDFWRAVSYGIGKISYTADTEAQPVFGQDDREYYTGNVHFHALTNKDYYALRWSSFDTLSHRALRYEDVYSYVSELLALGFEFPDVTVPVESRAQVSRLLRLKIGHSDGREYEVDATQFARYDNIPQALTAGSIYAYFDRLNVIDVNGREFRLRPIDVEYIELQVYPESYGIGINTEIVDFAVEQGLLRWFSVENFDVLPEAGDEYEILSQRCEIESVALAEGSTTKYIVTLKETNGITIIMPASWRGGPINPYIFHVKDEVSLGDGGVKFDLKIAKDDENRFTGHVNRALDAWKPVTPIVDSSVQPLSIYTNFSEQGVVCPRLVISQAVLLGGGGVVSVKAGGEHWRTSAVEYLGNMYEEISPDLEATVDAICSEEFKEWVKNVRLAVGAFQLDGINVHMGIETPANAIGTPLADSILQADADGNKYERLTMADDVAEDYLSISIADIYDALDSIIPVAVAVSVDMAMWTFREDTRLINIYDPSAVQKYESETGQLVPTPYLREVDDITSGDLTTNAQYFAWLKDELTDFLTEAKQRVLALYPSADIDISVNVPRVKNDVLIALEPLNNTDYYDVGNWRNMFIASYDHVLAGDSTRVVSDLGFHGEHGYSDAESDYLAGLIPVFSDRWKWGRVDQAVNYAGAANIPRISVADSNAVMRDGFMWFGYGTIGESGFSCGGGTCCE